MNRLQSQEVFSALSSNGWSMVGAPSEQASMDLLVAEFDEVIAEMGREPLATMTRINVTGRRGGEYGYVRRVDQIESKDAFMFRNREPDLPTALVPGALRTFMEHGRQLVRESELAFSGLCADLEEFIPGIHGFHFADRRAVDVSMRVVLSDERCEPAQIVAEPHLDISSMTLHMRTNRPGTFFVEQPDGQVAFPIAAPGEAALFNGAWFGQSEEGSVLPAVFHGAVSGENHDGDRRGVVVSQLQPQLGVDVGPPTFEQTHYPDIAALQARVTAAYNANV